MAQSGPEFGAAAYPLESDSALVWLEDEKVQRLNLQAMI
jgi:hypothetical protein